jgi:membrane-bound lytic murein transglycosylase D
MAAYNAGEGKVLRALHKVQGKTFSDISRTKLIRQETKQYVPRIMAATIIARSPEQYGFDHTSAPPHQFEEVLVNRAMHFRAIASALSFKSSGGKSGESRRLARPNPNLQVSPARLKSAARQGSVPAIV